MTTQTPDAVREALQAKHDRIHPTNRRPDLPIMLKMTFGDLCAILAALDSRAGEAGEEIENGYTADDAVDFVFNRLSAKLRLAEWQVVEGSEEWEGDVSAILHRLLVDAGIINDETGAVATLATPRARCRCAGRGVPNMMPDHFRDATKMVDRNAVIQECASALATYCKRMNEAGKEPTFYDAREAILAMRSESAPAVDAVSAGEVRNLRPNLGAETDEPSLEEMVLNYYRRHYPIGEAFNLRDRYFTALSHGEGRK